MRLTASRRDGASRIPASRRRNPRASSDQETRARRRPARAAATAMCPARRLLERDAELGDALGHLGRQLRVRGGQRALEEDAHVGDREEDVAAALREEAAMDRARRGAGQGAAGLGRDDALADSDQERADRDEVGPLPDGGVADLGGHERGDTGVAQARRRARREVVGVEQGAGDVAADASQRHRRHAQDAEQAGRRGSSRVSRAIMSRRRPRALERRGRGTKVPLPRAAAPP